jgi:5-hydroxyisourate hydrolase
MAELTTHVLDIMHGIPAAGMRIELFMEDHISRTFWTNSNGRTDTPLLNKDEFRAGKYQLIFYVGDYFQAGGVAFLDRVPIWFGVADPTQHYHVPLVVSPWAYQTYRGS